MRHMRTFFYLVIVFFMINQPMVSASDVSEYTVTVHSEDPLRVFVKASLKTVGDTLYMNANCPNYDYPEGWASFIKNLSIVSSDGKRISHRYQTKSKWYLENKTSDDLTISYEVDLSFTEQKWDVGNEQAGYFDGDAVYLVSKALFIYGVEDRETVLTINMPRDWNLAVPWRLLKDRTYQIPNREFLIENSLVYGTFYTKTLSESGFDFSIALLGTAKEAGELFSAELTKTVNAYLRIFPDTPPTIYLITIFYADLDDGESFYNSYTFTLKTPMDRDNKIVWANQMSHELFHYWNSDLIRAESYAERQWFSEGTAEYYANLTMVRQGIVSKELFRNKMEKILALYQHQRGWKDKDTSLLKAGEKKGRNRFLIYNGGWAIAMALDVTIMESTDGQKTLDDFMNAMFQKHRSTPYTYADLVETASEVAGVDLSSFFAKYVEGTELLPLAEYLDKLGYRMLDIIYEAEIYLLPKEESNPLRDLWLRKSH